MKKILIINHDPDTMELLEGLLQLRGYKIRLNDTLQEVAGTIKEFKPDLLLVDATSKLVIDVIKESASNPTLPILFMTGHNSNFDETNNSEHTVRKPFTMDQLSEKITGMLA